MADLLELEDLRSILTIHDRGDDAALTAAITAASRAVENYCGQAFTDAGSVSARSQGVTVIDHYTARCDPFHTLAGLVIKTDGDDDGTYETTWTGADYELERFGGDLAYVLAPAGTPYDTIRAVGSYSFPTAGTRRWRVQVTAQWGWATVPEPVKFSTKLMAHDLWKRKDAPGGIAAGGVELGGVRLSPNVYRQVEALLGDFVRLDRTVGIG